MGNSSSENNYAFDSQTIPKFPDGYIKKEPTYWQKQNSFNVLPSPPICSRDILSCHQWYFDNYILVSIAFSNSMLFYEFYDPITKKINYVEFVIPQNYRRYLNYVVSNTRLREKLQKDIEEYLNQPAEQVVVEI